MGYYANFDCTLNEPVVDTKKAKNLEKYFADDQKETYGFLDVKLKLIDVGGNRSVLDDIIVIDHYNKFYDDKLFTEKLSKVLISGSVDLHFIGEDRKAWGWRVSPNEVRMLTMTWVLSESE